MFKFTVAGTQLTVEEFLRYLPQNLGRHIPDGGQMLTCYCEAAIKTLERERRANVDVIQTGKRVRSTKWARLEGIVIGTTLIRNPWNNSEQLVHVVKLDEGIQLDSALGHLSIVVLDPNWVQVLP